MNLPRLYATFALLILLSAPVLAEDLEPLNLKWIQGVGGQDARLADISNDSHLEIIISSTSPQRSDVYVTDDKGNLLWKQRINEIWPNNDIRTVFVEDIDGNGDPEFIISSHLPQASRNNPVYVLERVEGLDYGMLKWADYDHDIAYTLYAADINQDNLSEVLVGTQDAVLYALDSNGALIWEHEPGFAVWALTSHDFEGLGYPDLVAGAFRHVFLYDYLGNQKWSYTTSGRIGEVLVDDLEGDGTSEILALGVDDKLYVLNSFGALLWSYKNPDLSEGLAVGDVDHDGEKEIIIVSGRKKIVSLDLTGNVEWTYTNPTPIQGILIEDIDANGFEDLIVYTLNDLYFYEVNPRYLLILGVDEVYEQSLGLFHQEFYLEAKEKALEAKTRYLELEYIGKLHELNNVINKSTKFLEAKKFHEEAKSLFDAEKFDEAAKNGKESLQIYRELFAKNKTAELERFVELSKKYNEVKDVFSRARDSYRGGDFKEGKRLALEAKGLYTELDDESGVSKANILMQNAEDYLKADSYYQEALDYFDKRQYETSKSYVSDARQIYQELGDSSGIEKSDKLLLILAEKLSGATSKYAGDAYLEQASQYQDSRQFDLACAFAKKARNSYNEVSDHEGVENAGKIISSCTEKLRRQSSTDLANEYYQNALLYLSKGDETQAKRFAEDALELYSELGNDEGMVNAGDLLTRLETEDSSSRFSNLSIAIYLLFAVILLCTALLALVVGYWFYRRVHKQGQKPNEAFSDLTDEIVESIWGESKLEEEVYEKDTIVEEEVEITDEDLEEMIDVADFGVQLVDEEPILIEDEKIKEVEDAIAQEEPGHPGDATLGAEADEQNTDEAPSEEDQLTKEEQQYQDVPLTEELPSSEKDLPLGEELIPLAPPTKSAAPIAGQLIIEEGKPEGSEEANGPEQPAEEEVGGGSEKELQTGGQSLPTDEMPIEPAIKEPSQPEEKQAPPEHKPKAQKKKGKSKEKKPEKERKVKKIHATTEKKPPRKIRIEVKEDSKEIEPTDIEVKIKRDLLLLDKKLKRKK
ncbi:MAG: hypothetical protein ABH950_05890 [Candidatus Altiarchaeota archaeon]